jgi:hypothetical protein
VLLPLRHRFSGPLLLAISASSCAVPAFAFTEFARGALTLETRGTVTYDSYFLGSANHDSDFYETLRPQLNYSRNAGLSKFNASLGMAFNRYNKFTSYNSDDVIASLNASLPVEPGSRLDGNVTASYNESKDVDPVLLERVSSKALAAGLNFNYQLGLKTALTDAFSYNKTIRQVYSDQETFSNNVGFTYSDFLYESNLRFNYGLDRTKSSGDNFRGVPLDQTAHSFTGTFSRPIIGALNGELTYGYRTVRRSKSESDIGQKNQDGAIFSVSINGPFLPPSRFPKLTSSASLSYQESVSPGINDTGGKTLTGDMNLSWAARERTDVYIRANRSLTLSANDLTVEDTRVSTGLTEHVGIATTIDGSLAYSWHKFRGISRNDNTLEASLSADHSLSKYWSFGASYEFQKNNSDATGLQPTRFLPTDYNRHLVSVFVTNVF